jgi:branched-chain amino acid transport system substrate-binding protein
MRDDSAGPIDRRRRAWLQGAACTGALSLGVPLVGSGCTSRGRLKIGYLTSTTGMRATFSQSSAWMVGRIRALLRDGLSIAGHNYATEILVRDTESNTTHAAKVGTDLLLNEGVDLLLADDGDSHYVVGDLCDQLGIPFISTLTQWEPFLYTRGSTAESGFPWCFLFCFGAHDIAVNYVAQWNQLTTNRVVADLYLDHPAGHAFADPATGVPAELAKFDYRHIAGGYYPPSAEDFSAQLAAFKDEEAQILSGFMLPPHFSILWEQAARLGYGPEVCTVAAAFLFPSGVEALGKRGDGMSTEVWWTPDMPFRSSLTGQSARVIADQWEDATGKQWTQPIGYVHALFEVGLEALKRSGDPKDREAVRDAIAGLSLDTLVGAVNFRDSPIRSVAVTEMAMGQWRRERGGRFPFRLLITSNTTAPHIVPNAQMRLLSEL